MRDIDVGEELTTDYAMLDDYEGSMECAAAGAPLAAVVLPRSCRRARLEAARPAGALPCKCTSNRRCVWSGSVHLATSRSRFQCTWHSVQATTVGTMAGAIAGALTEAMPDYPILDLTLIRSEAERLASLGRHQGSGRIGHEYPDLLHWVPPRTQAVSAFK